MDDSKLVIDEEVCRICKSSEGGQLLIFGLSGAERNLPTKIQDCLPIKVSDQDGLPKTICAECAEKLEDFYQFRQQSRQTESILHQIFLSDNNKSDSECSNSKISETSKDKERTSTPLSIDTQSSSSPKKKPHGYAKLSQPQPEDYVLMKEETFTIDNSIKKSNIMGDYLIEFNNNNNKLKNENEIQDVDILNAMRKRREVLPPMWDVFERGVGIKQEQDSPSKPSSSKTTPTTGSQTVKQEVNKTVGGGSGKLSVTHRRYIVAKGAFPCSLCGRCFLFNQGRPREGIPYADADIVAGDQDSATESPTEYPQRDDGLYACPQCKKLFPRRSSLKRHQQIHIDGKKFICKICNKGFGRNEHLNRHMLLHNNPHPFQCELCSKVFTRKEHLSRHKLIHPQTDRTDDEQQQQLSVPGYNFMDFEPTEDKPFVCDVCHSSYARREHMAKHKKVAHGIEIDPESEPKPYCCNHCFKTFTRKEHLTRHKKIHLREAFSGNYEIAEGVSPSQLIAGPPGSKVKDSKKKEVLIPVTVNTKNTPTTPQLNKSSLVKPLAVTPVSVNKDTVTLEISGGSNNKNDDNLLSNMFKNGKYGEISIDYKKDRDDNSVLDASSVSNDYESEFSYGGKNLTEEEKAQLEGFLAETSFGGMDFLGGGGAGGGGGGGGLSNFSTNTVKSEELDEHDFEKECIDMEDLRRMPKCRLCHKAFTKKNHLNRHLKRYHNLSKEQISSGKYELQENGTGGEVEELDADDFYDEEGNPILKRPRGSFPCDICKKTFTRKYHMYRHQKTQHGIDFPTREQQKADNMKCMFCHVQFKTTEELRRHACANRVEEPEVEESREREVKRKPKNSFKCAICKSSFESHDGFKDHVCKKVEKTSPGGAGTSGGGGGDGTATSDEVKKVSGGYKCEQCGECFDKTRYLAAHLETHMNIIQGMLFT